jgi:hypothetical protein
MPVALWLAAALGIDWNMGSGQSDDWVMVSRPAAAQASELDWSMLSSAPQPAAAVAAPRLGYPVRGNHWSIGASWNADRKTVLAHLHGGQHAGKWDAAWLATLSHAELLSLHDDDHEGRVQWAHVRRPTTATKPAVQPVYYTQPARQPVKSPRGVLRLFARPSGQTCPGGRCPR